MYFSGIIHLYYELNEHKCSRLVSGIGLTLPNIGLSIGYDQCETQQNVIVLDYWIFINTETNQTSPEKVEYSQ